MPERSVTQSAGSDTWRFAIVAWPAIRRELVWGRLLRWGVCHCCQSYSFSKKCHLSAADWTFPDWIISVGREKGMD